MVVGVGVDAAYELPNRADGNSLSDDDSMCAAAFGATVATPRFYDGGRLMWVNERDVDPVFSIIAGLPF